jgi:hypothetical protein
MGSALYWVAAAAAATSAGAGLALSMRRRVDAILERYFESRLDGKPRKRKSRKRVGLRASAALSQPTTSLALLIAGRRRSRLRDEWKSDLTGPDGEPVPPWLQLRHVAGYMIAALRYRMVNDLGDALGRVLDAILASRVRTAVVAFTLVAIQAGAILRLRGLSGLLAGADQPAALAGALALAIRWLRNCRGVRPTKRARRGEKDT